MIGTCPEYEKRGRFVYRMDNVMQHNTKHVTSIEHKGKLPICSEDVTRF